MWRCLRYSVFSGFDTIPVCDRRRDRRTDRQTHDDAHCFPIRVTVLWNRLPASVVLADDIQMFKKLLKHVDFSCAMFGKA